MQITFLEKSLFIICKRITFALYLSLATKLQTFSETTKGFWEKVFGGSVLRFFRRVNFGQRCLAS